MTVVAFRVSVVEALGVPVAHSNQVGAWCLGQMK